MCSAFVSIIEKDQSSHIKSATMAMSFCLDGWPPRVKKSVKDLFDCSLQVGIYAVRFTDFGKCGVQVPREKRPLISYHVDLNNKTCYFGKWLGTNFPCIRPAVLRRASWQELSICLDKFSSTSTFKAECSGAPYSVSHF